MSLILKKDLEQIILDLQKVSSTFPNERKPKEEQIRCLLFHSLKARYDLVCAEKNYFDVDSGKNAECDIFVKHNELELWLEIKTCWGGRGWNNKPQWQTWADDIEKLKEIPKPQAERAFLLVGFFSHSPVEHPKVHDIFEQAEALAPKHLVSNHTDKLKWRNDELISHVGYWLWSWQPGERIKTPFKQRNKRMTA